MANGRSKLTDIVRGVVLPSLAIGESIVTRGASPGTASLRVAQSIDERRARELQRKAAEEKRKRDLERDALTRQLQGFQVEQFKARRSKEEENAASLALLRKKLDLAGEDEEKRTEAVLQHQLRTDPDKALAFMQRSRLIEDQQRREAQKQLKLDRQRISKEQKEAGIREKKDKREFLKDQRDFKKSFISDTRIKTFNEVESSFERINSVWSQRPDKNDVGGNKKRAAIDQALITLYNKMLDPGSVVRESEYARTPQNVPVINRIQGRLQQVVEGGAGLTDADRNEIFEVAKRLFDSSRDRYKGILQTYERDINDSGFDKENIFTPRDLAVLGQRGSDARQQKIDSALKTPTDIESQAFKAQPVKGLSNNEVSDIMTFITRNPRDPRARRMRQRLQQLGVEVP